VRAKEIARMISTESEDSLSRKTIQGRTARL
jgi:hypothetical protein